MNNEVFKPVIGYEECYEIGDLGTLRSITREIKKWNGYRTIPGRIVTPKRDKDGYPFVQLYQNGIEKNIRLGRLVGLHFVPNPNNLPEINHKFGDKDDSRAVALEWTSRSENQLHAYKHGLQKPKKGKDNITSRPVLQMTKTGIPIKEFGSQKEAERITGIRQTNISACALGKPSNHTAGGYKWKFV